jgi:hypothetical protein
MFTRTLAASVLPRTGRLRAVVPSLRQVRSQLTAHRQRSLSVQDRVDRVRARCNERYGYGRRS